MFTARHDERTLFQADLRTHPSNVKLLNNLGKLEEASGDYSSALRLYNLATQSQPNDVRGWLNCANLHTKLGNYSLAENYYRKAIASLPALYQPKPISQISSRTANRISSLHSPTTGSVSAMQLRAAINLANLLSNNPLKKNEATRLYERLVTLKPDWGQTYFDWIQNLLRGNSTDRNSVQRVFLRLINNARQLDCDLLYNVAVLLSNSGDSLMALQLFDQILKLNPVHQVSFLYYLLHTALSDFISQTFKFS